MKLRLSAAAAFTFALAQIASPAALAQADASPFRSVEAKTFSEADLMAYGLSAEDAARAANYQAQGYTVQLVTPEEAEAYNAGLSSDNALALVGLVVLVVVAASVF